MLTEALQSDRSVFGACRAVDWASSVAKKHFSGHQSFFREQSEQMAPELLAHKGIEDGIDSAVHKGQSLSEIHGYIKKISVWAGVADQLTSHQCVHKFSYVIGQPADDKSQHHTEDHFHCFGFLAVTWAKQGSNRAAVADQHDCKWKEKAKDVTKDS